MKSNRLMIPIAAATGMLLLILDSRSAISGAAEGLQLCLTTVVPSLLPFFVLSILLTGSLTGQKLPVLQPLSAITGIPSGAESILLTGLLGGYPVGAQALNQAYRSGHLTQQEAARMLAFCNNAGPAFLFGMAASLFPYGWMGWALWLIHIFSALLTGWLMPHKSRRHISLTEKAAPTLPGALSAAVRVMAGVCGWVIIFRVVIAFLEKWLFWLLPAELSVLLTGLLELTNGCCALGTIDSPGLRFVLCSGMLAFGGLCVGMQTISVAEDLDRRLYFPGKLLQTLFSVLLAILAQGLLPTHQRVDVPWIIPLCFAAMLGFFVIRIQKSSSIPAKAGV